MQWNTEIEKLLTTVEEILTSADSPIPETGESIVPGQLIAKLQQSYSAVMSALDSEVS